MSDFWQTSRFRIDLSEPRVMGIVNITPDSFSDGGAFFDTAVALRHCDTLVSEGADLLDLGAESTRPGSLPISADVELARLMPVLVHAVGLGVPVSVDTSKPEVMRRALDAGADIVNDVWALRRPGARDAVAAHPACGICLMHMHRDPQSMQSVPMEGDPVPQVLSFWEQQMQALIARGVDLARVVLDPGIGFGKTVSQNLALLARQGELLASGRPLLIGWSRKSTLGMISKLASAQDRLVPSVAAALLAVERGARIVRVHDVRSTVEALAVWRSGTTRVGRADSTQKEAGAPQA